jgi:hypothetical protein
MVGGMVSLKGCCGFSFFFASHVQWSPIFISLQTSLEIIFRVCAMDSDSERNRFLVGTEMGNSVFPR